MSHSWKEELQKTLVEKYGEHKGRKIFQEYKFAFPHNYCEKNEIGHTLSDISKLEKLAHQFTTQVELCERDADNSLTHHLKLFQIGNPIALSDILPILENLGVRTHSEETYTIKRAENKYFYISDFTISFNEQETPPLASIKHVFEEALTALILQNIENDSFNKLITAGGISAKEIAIIRAYSKYLKQIKYRYSQLFIEKTLVTHVNITKSLLKLFDIMHNPQQIRNEQNINEALDTIEKNLETVKSIDEDSVIRRLLLLIKITLRTNYYQASSDGIDKDYITLKINTSAIPDAPLPTPLIDTFVYSPLFEGIHLRSQKVSRGGIRWSDRTDDYRSEILGLMKAQRVKNSIIIPSGAKGGFIVKDAALKHAGNDIKKCTVCCYQQFIRGLLDITDNIVNNKIVHPENVVCHDENDAYLVVAADKGTADLSDYANSISNEYSFWLGDAFASGGSNGYDHKKLGITAKGAWESLKRSLMEINLQNEEISIVAIGDMSGDVFGNGMIYSNNLRLVAAFDHRHIFLDPEPNSKTSFQERIRLYNLPSSSWNDYDRKLISHGGGVFARTEKTIPISPEVKKALDITESELTPDQLICAILKAPTDVLYNGGIGTYVKASKETSENVGDKLNEFCRVDANQLRCKIVCEGGNLGFTQLARVEYALNGGIINTDFIDNSAGVDCSDHEVNIKILLNKKIESKEINLTARNVLLTDMEEDVCRLVLQNNYVQAVVMSYSSLHATDYSDLYQEHINKLESVYGLNRRVENLPLNDELIQRKSSGKGLTKPELAILLSYTKLYVKDEILKSAIPDSPYFNFVLNSAFPQALSELYQDDINNHPLKREIIATQISNSMLNCMGVTYPFRLQDETGSTMSEIAAAYILASRVFNTDAMHLAVQSLDNQIPLTVQYQLLHSIRCLLNMATRWFLRNCRLHGNLTEIEDYFGGCVKQLADIIPTLIVGSTKNFAAKINELFQEAGLSPDIVKPITTARVMYNALNIAEISSAHGFDLIKTAKLYFLLGKEFNLAWFRDTISNDTRPGKRSNLARLTLRDDLDALQRRLAIVILQSDPTENDIEILVKNWTRDHKGILERWQSIMTKMTESQSDDYAMLFIALHELSNMIDGMTKSEKILLLAYHDALTKLPNRFSINDRIDKIQKRCEQDGKSFAIHFVDLDKFKAVNDTYGHQIGDQLLIEVTKRLVLSVRSGDIVARQGGDEFIIVQTDLSHRSEAELLANKLAKLISEPFYIENNRILISASIGIAIYPNHGRSALELIAKADKAMYTSKEQGVAQVAQFE